MVIVFERGSNSWPVVRPPRGVTFSLIVGSFNFSNGYGQEGIAGSNSCEVMPLVYRLKILSFIDVRWVWYFFAICCPRLLSWWALYLVGFRRLSPSVFWCGCYGYWRRWASGIFFVSEIGIKLTVECSLNGVWVNIQLKTLRSFSVFMCFAASTAKASRSFSMLFILPRRGWWKTVTRIYLQPEKNALSSFCKFCGTFCKPLFFLRARHSVI